MRSAFLLVPLAFAIDACGSPSEPDAAHTVSAVTITAPRTNLVVGGTLRLSAEAANADGTTLPGKKISWVSNHPEWAKVTSEGLVTGVATGTTIITAMSEGHSGTITLNIYEPNKITLVSDAGDFIGQGLTYTYTSSNSVIRVSANSTLIELFVTGKESWRADFQARAGSQLTLGSYMNAERYLFQQTGNPGMGWFGQGRGCNTTSGFFIIDSLLWDAVTGTSLLGLDVRFEQHCEGLAPALRGTIHWRADDPTVPASP